MLSTSARGSTTHRISTSVAGRLLVTAALVASSMALAQPSRAGDDQRFFVLDNPGDANFNQLLGINDAQVIVGYFGDGAVVANNGYVLVPRNHYAPENVANAAQTQAIGINDKTFPDIVGFFTDDATGFTHGFLDADGAETAIDDPRGSPPNVTTPVQNLLGINDRDEAAGFWTDNDGHTHGFVVDIDVDARRSTKFIEIPPSTFRGAVATLAADITDTRMVCGFWTDAQGNNHGFFGRLGTRFDTFNVRIRGVTVTSTEPFGCNNENQIVGSFTDAAGGVHGFIFTDGRFVQFDAPGSSQTTAFGVAGTIINGINDRGDIVGFFSDGAKVHGFARFAHFRNQRDED
jgi:hypothetical protein